MKKRLGELLLERHLIDVDQLNSALGHQRQWGMRLGTALVAKGFIAEGELMRVLSESLGIPMADLSKVTVDPKALALIPARMCEQYEIFPLSVKEQKGRNALLLAMSDPLNVTAIDEIAFMTGCVVTPTIAQISSIDHAIQRHYQGKKIEIAPLNFAAGLPRSNAFRTGAGPGPQSPPPARSARSSSSAATNPGDAAFQDFSGEGDALPLLEPQEPVVMGVSLISNKTLSPDNPYAGQPTGVFAMVRSDEGAPVEPLLLEPVVKPVDFEAIEALEKKFWALLRVLTRRGLVTKDELLAEMQVT
ncbi:MAG TPA: hypothetical protein VGO62_18700 [Myxococcota bacterium]|jgi:hypothetical protein